MPLTSYHVIQVQVANKHTQFGGIYLKSQQQTKLNILFKDTYVRS